LWDELEVGIDIEEVTTTGDTRMLGASADREIEADAEAEIGDGFKASAGLDLGTEVELDAELDAELEVGPGLDAGAEDGLTVEFGVGSEGCVEAENESAADFVLDGREDVWLDCN
jgi:hypothetical protein